MKLIYEIEKYSQYILISFKTNNDYKYRLDIFKCVEHDKSNNFINHMAFNDYNNDINDIDKYEELLNRNEMIEIINRIHYILKNLLKNNKINNNFCIGSKNLLAKNNIYQYILKILIKNNFEKLSINIYDTGFELYFDI